MKLLAVLLLAVTAQAAPVPSVPSGPLTARLLAADCKGYLEMSRTDGNSSVTDALDAAICMGYVRGVMEEMAGETITQKDFGKPVVGVWQNASVNDIIRMISVDVILSPDDKLWDRPATEIIRKLSLETGRYRYIPAIKK